MKKRIRVFYRGNVQGVGFRFTAEHLAKAMDISGWVQNLKDGKVEVIAQAEEAVLKEYLKKIHDHFSPYIKDFEIKWLEVDEYLQDFEIKF
ncbi:MAG: acylphosphatase [Candidatus Omnitrophica bacterium]|nr:acylphosphatase [Candidatus Omnitrophota bacterium]MDD5653079.1 acylphosphatase [Candidatus Omnitrophota bacterium]